MTNPTTGKFCWHDCMTTDMDKAVAFYSELFGWQVNETDMDEIGKYRMIRCGEQDIGGFVPMEPGAEHPPHWIGYVTTDDVDAAAERAKANGGALAVPPTDIPHVGRFAVIGDPSGAYLSPFKSAHEMPADADCPPMAPGCFVWDELLTNDVEGSRAFYGEVFGWGYEEHDMGEMGTYTILKRGDTMAGGMMKMPPNAAGAPTHWLHYVAVEDVDASAEKIGQLGGTVICPPMDIPNVGRSAVATDPTGAAFALFKSAPMPE